MEIAWRLEDARALTPRNRSALLETICTLRRRLEARGGSSRFIWCPAHVGVYGNLAADAVAKAFLYGPVTEPRLRVRRSMAANTGPSVDVSSTASCAAPTGRVPGLRGAFIIASTPCSSLVMVSGTNIAQIAVLLCSAVEVV